ncbi:MAG: helix-turn-helix transcriptional regulator [Planctomycetes bacterium]|nr:helix-turn-helix transcriptional regulator [Planctomycetota bacterium]
MTWSEKHKVWVDADSRTPAERQRDQKTLSDVESDRERIDQILRSVREYGEASSVEEAAAGLARTLLESLIEARRKAGLSQAEVARRMRVPQPAIVRLEAGTHSPTLSTLARYASAIGVALDVRQPK